ncbi:AGAP000142-PA-like protein [Anopheles sinensis]|uniref:WD repeat-containing protein 44 n=1 Tax=Anopheles sinensis TaxID=74873 RepID=A0A084WFR1_ANOSI|nr:AGAP000142-PA-like protein [Anopheles sinensis]
MASGSESSDEFYDAMDDSLVAKTLDETTISNSSSKRRSGRPHDTEFTPAFSALHLEQPNHSRHGQPAEESGAHVSSKEPSKSPKLGAATGFATSVAEHVFKEPKSLRSQRFHEFRQAMQNDEDENPGNILTPDSQNSSVEGVYVAPRSNYPFRVIESDVTSIHSICSLGIVGRIMAGGSIDASDSSTKEPTVSAKTNEMLSAVISTVSMPLAEPRPVAPPRRKKKMRKLSSSSSDQCTANETGGGGGAGTSDQQPTDSSSSEVLMVKSAQSQPMIAKLSTDDLGSGSGEAMAGGTNGGSIVSSGSDGTTTTGGADSYSGKTLPSPATLESITREIENSFEEAASAVNGGTGSLTRLASTSAAAVTSGGVGGSAGLSRCTTTQLSPTGSMKSVSAMARASWTDNSQGLISRVTKGQYVVKPTDGVFNKAEGPSGDEIARIGRIHKEFLSNISNSGSIGGTGAPGGGGGGGGPGRGSLGSHRKNYSITGTNSLEGGMRTSLMAKQLHVKERRKSAGDEDMLKQLNMYVRTRTSSGKQLTDMEILEQVPVKNLDTGENFPLSAVEEKLPQCINPLSLHIMRLTSHIPETDEESVGPGQPGDSDSVQPGYEEELEAEGLEGGRLKRRTAAKLKRFFRTTAKKTVSKAKSIASEVSHARHKEDVADIQDVSNPEQNIKIKASSTNKGPYDFAKLQHVQDLTGVHTVAVWCMKFSSCGRLLATAGQDRVLCIWVLKDAYPFFQALRTKYNAADQKSSPTPSEESLNSTLNAAHGVAAEDGAALPEPPDDVSPGPFMPHSFCTYSGHTSDLLDVSWSKNYFILSSSMDKTVRLWHISRRECLCCFQHIDFVTAIAFHPRDDRYFLSGSLDGKLRLWNIPEKKVALWNEVDGQTKLITAANFCANGKFAVVGSYDGRCIFYNTDQLKYHTQIHVRSTRGRNAIGRKISGIEPMPGEDKILVTSNDSRIRLYDLRDLNLSCKYKGYFNSSSQIKASFSHDGKYIISGSENQCIYIWKTHHEYTKLSSVRRDRSDFWEGIKAHNATVTCAIFAPHPEAIIKPDPDESTSADNISVNQSFAEQSKKACRGYVMVSADFNGCIKVFINKTKPKHSSLPYTAIAD